MPRTKSVKSVVGSLTLNELDQLLEMLKKNPRITKLEKQLAALDQKRETLAAEIATLKVKQKKRGRPAAAKRKPGRQNNTDASVNVNKSRGRPVKVKAVEAIGATNKRGRPAKIGVSTPEMRAATAKAAKKVERTSAQQRAINLRMEKARAARKHKASTQ